MCKERRGGFQEDNCSISSRTSGEGAITSGITWYRYRVPEAHVRLGLWTRVTMRFVTGAAGLLGADTCLARDACAFSTAGAWAF